MLRRFMTWLLNKVQKVLSVLGSKRGRSRTAVPNGADTTSFTMPDASAQSSDITVAKRSSASVSSSRVSTTLPHQDVVIADSAAQDAQDSDVALPDEVAIHNRLDVASASVSGASETRSSVPSEVSELLSVVDPERTDDVSEHFVGDLADEQLPLIQDLLPAVASSDGGSADAESEVKQSKAEESLLKEATADNNAMELSDPAKSALSTDTPARPVLFRFDIIESTEKLESADIQGSVDEHAVKISGAETSKSGADAWTERDASLDGDSVAGLDSPIADGLEVDGLELESDAGTLRSATPIKKEEEEELQPVFQQTESVSSTDPSKNYPVKIGTVKLLFMFKKGNFHGYIAPDDGSKDILFHQKYINADIFTKLERGAQVSAAVKYIEGKAYATHVELL